MCLILNGKFFCGNDKLITFFFFSSQKNFRKGVKWHKTRQAVNQVTRIVINQEMKICLRKLKFPCLTDMLAVSETGNTLLCGIFK